MMNGLAWIHTPRDVPSTGLVTHREATADELKALAEALELPSVEALTADYRLRPAAGGSVRLEGRLSAHITQECIVTLEPVSSVIETSFEALFVPEEMTADQDDDGTATALDAPEREPMENGTLDVGRIIFEELASSLDPYPRKAGAAFEWTDAAVPASRTSPFAALARLRKPDPET